MADERATVFVIDDDPSMREALEDLITSVGLEARLFASPREFLESKRPDAPGCLVLDVRLPGMSGLTFQQELAKTGSALPVIFLTGHGDIPMSVRAMKAGAIEFLTKPFHDQELLDAIHAAIERDRRDRREGALVGELQERYGSLTGRGNPVFRGIVTGLMTFIGGFLHTLPFLISNLRSALTLAYAVVGVELVVIAFIRHKYFKTSFALSCLQVIVGGGLVFAAGVLIGQS